MRDASSRRQSAHALLWFVVAMGVLAILTSLQRQMIYYPAVAEEGELLEAAAQLGMTAWRDDSGGLIGWRPAGQGADFRGYDDRRDGARRMLVFHGNAGYALNRAYFVEGFGALGEGWEVFLFEYPGYGARPGNPSEQTIKAAATAAFELLLHQDERPVYLIGESLGSGVASHLAAKFPEQVAGLLLVTPFTSLPDVAARHFRWLPVRALLDEDYDAEEALRDYDGPAAFLLAGEDEVVPVELGKRLHDGYSGPAWLRVIPGAGHNSLPLYPAADWWEDVSAFLLAPRQTQ